MTEAVLKKFFKEYKPQLISTSSQTPSQILDTLKTIEITSDTVIITNGDVWRYFNVEHDIFNHDALQGKTVVLQTSGYSNIKHNNLHYHISFPMWYWKRTHSTNDRFILGHNLYVNNLLEDMIFSQNLVETNYEILEQDLNTLDLPKFHEYENLLPILLDEYKGLGPIDFKNFRNQPGGTPLDHPAFSNAYCFISVESECEEYPYSRNINLPVVTEKSYKSFITRQIPLVVGARGHYAYLKSLGFEMMEDFLPEGYDDMPFLEKVDAIVSTVAKGKEFAKDFYFSHLPEIQHNYELVNSTKVEELILKRIHTLLTP